MLSSRHWRMLWCASSPCGRARQIAMGRFEQDDEGRDDSEQGAGCEKGGAGGRRAGDRKIGQHGREGCSGGYGVDVLSAP